MDTSKTTARKVAPYGTWVTPFTADSIVKHTIGFGTIVVEGDDIYWIETRPEEEGRHVVVRRRANGTVADTIPREFNARSRVHEYGGGAYTVHNTVVYFVQYDDQRLWVHTPGELPKCLNTRPGMRFAEPVFDAARTRIIAVCEDHRKFDEEAVNSIVSLALDGSGDYKILAGGSDFYSSPKLSPDGKYLAFVSWKHPNMPWDLTQLYVAELTDDNKACKPKLIAGGENESIVLPEWSPDGTLYFVSDKSNYWNIYRFKDGKVEVCCEERSEFGRASWHLGYSQYGFLPDGKILCSYNTNGFWHIGILDPDTKELKEIDTGFTDIWWLKTSGGKAVFRGASPTQLQSIVLLDPATGQTSILASATDLKIDLEMIARPQAVEFTAANRIAHGFYYPPKNCSYNGPEGEKPPLLIKVHGGPTGSASTMLNLELQYWTSRGFAVLDVNYRGSAGYGRSYRDLLHGAWGITDVEDCVSGAKFLINRGDADPSRLIISGGSAGGFTVLSALTTTKIFQAGASYYGICDLEAMTQDTHKFESRYLDKLVGPYPDARERYVRRSAIHHADSLSCPVIFFQGLQDKIVPPNQTVMMFETLKKKGIATACMLFEHEQHGFRRATTIRQCLESELYFYSRVFSFYVPEAVGKIEISNL